MPENFRRPIVQSEGANKNVKVPSFPSKSLDLTNLTEQEEKIIQNVLQKDELERTRLDTKISEIRREIQELRKAGALTSGDDQDTICARCKYKFPSFLFPLSDHGLRCTACKFKVCRKCCTQEPSGMWLCILCLKYRQEKWLTGEWLSKGETFGLQGSDLIRVSLRNRSQIRKEYEDVDQVTYTQRPAIAKEVDSDSRTSRNSQSSSEQLGQHRHCKRGRFTLYNRSRGEKLSSPTGPRHKAGAHHMIPSPSAPSLQQFRMEAFAGPKSRLLRDKHLGSNSRSAVSLYYDDVKAYNPHLSRLNAVDSQSTSSLSSDHGQNPKYKSMRTSSGASELELFRKKGERYATRIKKSHSADDPPVPSADEAHHSSHTEVTKVTTEETPIHQTASPKTSIPHWHITLKKQAAVIKATRQLKSQKSHKAMKSDSSTSMPSEKEIFPLVKPKSSKSSSQFLSPDPYKDDSHSSMESISMYVKAAQGTMACNKSTQPSNEMTTSTPKHSPEVPSVKLTCPAEDEPAIAMVVSERKPGFSRSVSTDTSGQRFKRTALTLSFFKKGRNKSKEKTGQRRLPEQQKSESLVERSEVKEKPSNSNCHNGGSSVQDKQPTLICAGNNERFRSLRRSKVAKPVPVISQVKYVQDATSSVAASNTASSTNTINKTISIKNDAASGGCTKEAPPRKARLLPVINTKDEAQIAAPEPVRPGRHHPDQYNCRTSKRDAQSCDNFEDKDNASVNRLPPGIQGDAAFESARVKRQLPERVAIKGKEHQHWVDHSVSLSAELSKDKDSGQVNSTLDGISTVKTVSYNMLKDPDINGDMDRKEMVAMDGQHQNKHLYDTKPLNKEGPHHDRATLSWTSSDTLGETESLSGQSDQCSDSTLYDCCMEESFLAEDDLHDAGYSSPPPNMVTKQSEGVPGAELTYTAAHIDTKTSQHITQDAQSCQDRNKGKRVSFKEHHKREETSAVLQAGEMDRTDGEKVTLLHLSKITTWQSLDQSNSDLPEATYDLDSMSPKLGNKKDVAISLPAYRELVKDSNGLAVNNHVNNSAFRASTPEPLQQRSTSQQFKTSSGSTPLPKTSSEQHLSVPVIAVSTAAVEQQAEDDDLDDLFNKHRPQLLGSRSSLADSRESIYSVYSNAGEDNYGSIHVTGEILFNLSYNAKNSSLEVHIKQCRGLAPVDTKRNKSDPYVKTYLLPDKTRSGKRKTKIKKHTLNPTFDETLKYSITKAELESRTLWVTVWHNDKLGRNDFLGEVTIPLDYYRFDDNEPQWYPLQERAVDQDNSAMAYKGDLFIALRYVPVDMVDSSSKKKSGSLRKKSKEKPAASLGELHVFVKEAQNLTAMRSSAGSNPFCKGYLLPDDSHASKQKTPVIKKTTNPQWQHMLIFEGVDSTRLHQHGLELTIWDYEKLSSNDFLGGVRLNLGQGSNQGKPLDWMDARGEEIDVWQRMIAHPNEWVEAQLPLRPSMGKQTVKK